MTTKNNYYYGLGRRKTASARVRLSKGKGDFILNNKPSESSQSIVTAPLKIVGMDKNFDISAKTSGGGINSQIEAVRLGVSRALLKINPEFKKTLRLEGYLTRDPRAKERKKPGLKRARKRPQWQKR